MGEMKPKRSEKSAARAKLDRKSTNPKSETRQKILDTASKLFRDKGYAATTLRQIGDAAGLQAGSVYYHFDSKDDMICEILDIGITYVHEEVKRRIEELGPDADMRSRVEAAVDGHLFGLLSHGDYVSANIRNYGQLPEKLQERNRHIRQAYVSCWDRLLKKAQSEGAIRSDMDIKVLRLFIIGSLNWTVEWFDGEKGTVEGLTGEIRKILFEGIGTNSN